MQVLWDAWRVALPGAMFKSAWQWVSVGEDSLLTLGDRDQSPSEPTTDIAFCFYLSVDWPSELADHWLSLALADKQPVLEQHLHTIGYRIRPGADYPVLGKHRYRFVVDKKRIGQPSESGIFWALPTYEWQEGETLDPVLALRAEAIVNGSPCECPYCVRLGLSAAADVEKSAKKKTTAKTKPAAKKKPTAKTKPTAKKKTTAKTKPAAKKKTTAKKKPRQEAVTTSR